MQHSYVCKYDAVTTIILFKEKINSVLSMIDDTECCNKLKNIFCSNNYNAGTFMMIPNFADEIATNKDNECVICMANKKMLH